MVDIPSLIARLTARSDIAYHAHYDCVYTHLNDDKAKVGSVSRKDLQHHVRAAEYLGKHRALQEVIRILREEENKP